jgi:hypothetical protein
LERLVQQTTIELRQAALNIQSLLRAAGKEKDEDRLFVLHGVSRPVLLAEKQSLVRWATLWVHRNLAHDSWQARENELWAAVEELLSPSDAQKTSWSKAEQDYHKTMVISAKSERPDLLVSFIGQTFAELCGQSTNLKLIEYGEQMFEVTLGLSQDFMTTFSLIADEPM